MNIAERLKMPEFVTKGELIVTAYSRKKLIIDNYKGIIFFDSNKIIIRGSEYNVNISGSNLIIDYYTECDLEITGCINSISWG